MRYSWGAYGCTVSQEQCKLLRWSARSPWCISAWLQCWLTSLRAAVKCIAPILFTLLQDNVRRNDDQDFIAFCLQKINIRWTTSLTQLSGYQYKLKFTKLVGVWAICKLCATYGHFCFFFTLARMREASNVTGFNVSFQIYIQHCSCRFSHTLFS